MISNNKGGNVKIYKDFTLCSLTLVKEEATRTWSKLDHANGDVFVFNQKNA